MERIGDYINFRMKTCSETTPENYGADAGYGELPEGLPTDMNTFFVEHGITGDKLHDITMEIGGDYEGFLKKAQSQDETWGIPQSEWNKLSTNSRLDLMDSRTKQIVDDLDRAVRKNFKKEVLQALTKKLAELSTEYATNFGPGTDEEEIWVDFAESFDDISERMDGLEGYSNK